MTSEGGNDPGIGDDEYERFVKDGTYERFITDGLEAARALEAVGVQVELGVDPMREGPFRLRAETESKLGELTVWRNMKGGVTVFSFPTGVITLEVDGVDFRVWGTGWSRRFLDEFP